MTLKSLFLILAMLSAIIQLPSCQNSSINFCYSESTCYELNDLTFDEKWPQLNDKLNSVTEVYFHGLHLSGENFAKLLSHPMPQLKILDFHNETYIHREDEERKQTVLSISSVKVILQSSYFPKLSTLDLTETKINRHHLKPLESWSQQQTVNLRELKIAILGANSLEGKAFELLSNLRFKYQLQTLNVHKNSLFSDGAVNSLIKILKPSSESLSAVKLLNIHGTAIRSEGLKKLLSNIDLSRIEQLHMGNNVFHKSKHYDIPFDNSVFEYLASQKLSSLRILNMKSLELDSEQLEYFSRMDTPLLEVLDLSENFITDGYFEEWITSQKMPLLNSLSISQNDITDRALELLVNSTFQNLRGLEVANNRRFSSNYLEQILRLKVSDLETLDISGNLISKQNIDHFIENANLNQLRVFRMRNLESATTNLFQKNSRWNSMVNLRTLDLRGSDLSESWGKLANLNLPTLSGDNVADILSKEDEIVLSSAIKFPKLNRLLLEGEWVNKEVATKIVNALNSFAPQLELISIVNPEQNFPLCFDDLQVEQMPPGVVVDFYSVILRKLPNETKLQVIEFFMTEELITDNTRISDPESPMFGEKIQIYEIYLDITQNLKLVSQEFNRHLDFLTAERIKMDSYFNAELMKRILFQETASTFQQRKEYKKFIEPNSSYQIKMNLTLPYLLVIDNPAQDYGFGFPQMPPLSFYLYVIETPLLKSLPLSQMGTAPNDIFLMNKLSDKKRNSVVALTLSESPFTCDHFDQIFGDLTFPLLQSVILSNTEIDGLCLGSFVKRHPSVIYLDLENVPLQVNCFIDVIGPDAYLESFVADGVKSINDTTLVNITEIQTDFLTYLGIPQSRVTSGAFISLESKWKRMQKNSIFPKLQFFDLTEMPINQTGVRALLNISIPYLVEFQSKNQDNPEILNILLSYPNRLKAFFANNYQIYGFKKDLDPRSTRYIKDIIVQFQNLFTEDFRILSQCNLLKLESFIVALNNAFDCEVLKYVLSIVSNTKTFYLEISNEKVKGHFLDQDCLEEPGPDDNSNRNLKTIALDVTGEAVYIPKFVSRLYGKGQKIVGLGLDSFYIGDTLLLQIIDRCEIVKLEIISVKENLLTDKSVGQLFQLQAAETASFIDLARNGITDVSVEKLSGRLFPNLLVLTLSANQIGNEGIEHLVNPLYPRLLQLDLANLDFDRLGLMQLLTLNAPNLLILNICNNNISEEDLVDFFDQFEPDRHPLLMNVVTNVKMSEKNYEKVMLSLSFSSVQLIRIEVYKIKPQNSADISSI